MGLLVVVELFEIFDDVKILFLFLVIFCELINKGGSVCSFEWVGDFENCGKF